MGFNIDRYLRINEHTSQIFASDDASPVPNGPFDTYNFQGDGVGASDGGVSANGGRQLNVAIANFTNQRIVKRQTIKSSGAGPNLSGSTAQSLTITPTTGAGSEVLSVAYTPIRVGNLIRVSGLVLFGINSAIDMGFALFQGSTCIGAGGIRTSGGGAGIHTIPSEGEFTVAALTPVTISSRLYRASGSPNYFINANNVGTTAYFAASNSYIIIEEYDPTT